MVFRFMESRESSDNLLVSGCPEYDNDQEQDAVTILIKSRIPSVGPAIFASLSILRMSLTYVMPFGSLMKCI